SGAQILRYLTGQSAPPPVFDAQSTTVARQHGELFVGRGEHMQALREAFTDSKASRPVTVLVHGLSGMGKSALVRCFANELIEREEAVVLRGRCYERETVPYKAFDNIIDALSRYMMQLPADEAAELLPRNVHSLARLFPVLRRVKAVSRARRPKHQTSDPRELRNQAFAALKDLLLRITDYQPLVIQIDDLQWADMDSARLLSFLMGPPDPPALLLVGAYRRDEAVTSPFLRNILGEGGLHDGGADVRELPVDPLGADEAHTLTSELLRDMPTANALYSRAIALEAEGVPFFINELVQAIKARSESGHTARSMDSISLDDVIAERVRGMPKDAQRLLEVLSVAAGPIEQGIALEAAGLPPGDRASMLSLRAARLIRTRGTRQTDAAETYHDRVRETVVARMHVDAVRIAHARIAHAIEAADLGDPERLVDHYSGAGDGVRAGETAIGAARAAAEKLAFNRAAELFTKAIALLPRNAPQLRELHEQLGDALANAGRGAQAAEAYLEAARGAAPSHARKLQRVAAQQYLRSGRIAEGLPIARRLLADVGVPYPESSARVMAQILLDRARMRVAPRTGRPSTSEPPTHILEQLDTLGAFYKEVVAFDALRGAYLQGRFLRTARAAGEPSRIMQGVAWEALNLAVSKGELAARKVDALVAESDDLARRIDTPYARGTALLVRAGVNQCLARFDDVLEPAAAAAEIFRIECHGANWEQTFSTMWRWGFVELGGDLETFLKEAPAGEREADERGDEYCHAALTLILPMAHLMQDSPSTALDKLRIQQQRLGKDFTSPHLWLMCRTTDALLYGGDYQRAWSYLQEQWPKFSRSFLSSARLFQVNGHFLLGRAAVAHASIDRRSVRIAERMASGLSKWNRPDAQTYAALLQAAVLRRRGDREAALQSLDKAIEHSRAAKISNFELYARRCHGVLLGSGAGAQQVRAADEAMAKMGIERPDRWSAAWAPGFEG
ncbi:MAG: AAA family ATPase, partial [Myxococcales bacterium]